MVRRIIEAKLTPAEAAAEAGVSEPLLQLDAALLHALHERGFRVAIETNGTQPAPPGVD